MNREALANELQNIDIYLLDQILKGRFEDRGKILDAGCGRGRNMFWLLQNGYDVSGIDQDQEALGLLEEHFSQISGTTEKPDLKQGGLDNLPYPDQHFNAIICSAVLHFARSTEHFSAMFAELVRVLSPGGFLFIRMTSNIGAEHNWVLDENGRCNLPDHSSRFLLTRELLKQELAQHRLQLIEPVKTVNVGDMRRMTTLCLAATND